MIEEDIKKMNKVTSRYTRAHMFKMMNSRESIIKQELSKIATSEIETEQFIAEEQEDLYTSEEIGKSQEIYTDLGDGKDSSYSI